MYQFRPATERILYMRDRIRDRVIQVDAERSMLLTETWRDLGAVAAICSFVFPRLEIHNQPHAGSPSTF